MKPKSNYMDQEQFGKLLDNIPNLKIRRWKDEDVAMLFKIAYWCGLRMVEAVGLKAEDFDLNGKEVYLGETKTRKEDHAAIPDPFISELAMYLQGKIGELFPKCNVQIVSFWLRKSGRMLDIQALTTPQAVTGEKTLCHIFRKSIGKDLIYGVHGRKAPLNVVMKHLRHDSLDTTSKYLKVGIEDVKTFFDEGEPSASESDSWKGND